MRMMLRTVAIVAVAALSLGIAAGCGDDETSTPPPPPPAAETTVETTTAATETQTGAPAVTILEIPAAEQGLAYQKTEVSAPAGTVTLRMPNPSSIQHNITIEEPESVKGETVGRGGVSEVTADFEPGSYEYFCSVPGHREAGMVGTLTVT